ncbi:MAG: IS66 family insertion sequence element accessory protein TnpB [Clostridiaceae bacterium]
MDVQRVTAEYRMGYWSELIKECRSSGKTVNAWCEERNVGIKSYYYWLRKLRIAACSSSGETITPNGKVQPVFAQLNVPAAQSSAVVLKYNGITVEIQNSASVSTIENTLKALKAIC